MTARPTATVPRRRRGITARRARRARQRIAADRCPQRPGITHHWEIDRDREVGPGWSDIADLAVCTKCGVWRTR